jgi:hypothetical protein
MDNMNNGAKITENFMDIINSTWTSIILDSGSSIVTSTTRDIILTTNLPSNVKLVLCGPFPLTVKVHRLHLIHQMQMNSPISFFPGENGKKRRALLVHFE